MTINSAPWTTCAAYLPLRTRADGARFWCSSRLALRPPTARAPLVLSSVSPRRRALLGQAGLPFVACDPGPDPSLPRQEGWPAACASALHKAVRGARAFRGLLSLGADTVVVYQGRTLGKPTTPTEAEQMLTALSGRTHYVYTAFCLVAEESHGAPGDRKPLPPSRRVLWLEVVRSRVRFCALSDGEIAEYVASEAPFDKAGGYGIQDRGARLVESVAGSYYNVVGLPLRQVGQALHKIGWRGLDPSGRRPLQTEMDSV